MSDTLLPPETKSDAKPAYRVLARKYRPQSFDTLIGQEALVRTLRHAIAAGRIHHAYMLTGVRGVGKTTTARLVARALNYTGPDGTAGPTTGPTDDCRICRAIAEGRHMDVIEMDAASNTGVDNIREITDSVRYAPNEARYKVYIIDEVHMLSKSAFNALLKTLEEPPPHVIFIFATTEIRQVPVTVLSRCMRFDLRRVPVEVLSAHFAGIATQEGVGIEDEALRLVARAADGSVRDGLSLLDQAIAMGDGQSVTAQQMRDMLGLADRGRIFDLFEVIHAGKPAEALAQLDGLHQDGADAVVVAHDLLELTHFITRAKMVPDILNRADIPEQEATLGRALAQRLNMPVLTRTWQMLLKGLSEIQQAPVPIQALEMLVLRLLFAADLPPPGDLVKKWQDEQQQITTSPPGSLPHGGGSGTGASASRRVMGGGMASHAQPMQAIANPQSLRDVVALCREHREGILEGELYHKARLVGLSPGMIEISDESGIAATTLSKIAKALYGWTGRNWAITTTEMPGAIPLGQQDNHEQDLKLAEWRADPRLAAIFAAFPDARIVEIGQKAADPLPTPDPDFAGWDSDDIPDWLDEAPPLID